MALGFMRKMFPDMEIVSLSGNFCIDKKPAALNWWVPYSCVLAHLLNAGLPARSACMILCSQSHS